LEIGYWDLTRLLSRTSPNRADLGLAKVPHYSTLCKAAHRLLRKERPPSSSRPPRARPSSLIDDQPEAADAADLKTRTPTNLP
jgi:hypothetical protein